MNVPVSYVTALHREAAVGRKLEGHGGLARGEAYCRRDAKKGTRGERGRK
jgi:hypothetical protein